MPDPTIAPIPATLHCSGPECGATSPSAFAHAAGWTVVHARPFCPDCSADRAGRASTTRPDELDGMDQTTPEHLDAITLDADPEDP